MAKLLDVVRGKYVKSAPWVRRAVAPFLALLPPELRWGATYRRYREDISRSEVDAAFVGAYQMRQIRTLIVSCMNSPYYRSVFRETFGNSWEPRSLVLDDLKMLPVLTKSVLRETPETLLTKPLSQMDSVSTSGSSGEPFMFYLDRDRGAKEWAFHHHVWGRIGYKLEHKRAVLRGVYLPNVDVRPWAYDPALRELQLSPFRLTAETMDRYLCLIASHGVHFLHGYPSAISILAGHALRTRWKPPATLVGAVLISEPLLPHQRELLRTAFPRIAMMAHYGLSEKVAYASEVLDVADDYEFEPLYGYTELVDFENNPVKESGRSGRIVATGFLSHGMPFVRYDTGDVAELVDLPSQENRYRMRVRSIRPRRGQEFLVGQKGALVSVAAINVHTPSYARIRELQFFQDTPGEAQIRVVPLEGYTREDIEPFLGEVQRKVGRTIRFQLRICDVIEANIRGKKRFVDQRLDLERYKMG